ncbi:hypothetical protein SBA4_1210037 [Candidatus Sulfopaludibacter sp. SbA4]|nr:hypothetical protein SBA4_1210037 [Candidatus Sulfopaludibacter sp. SbA4]
MRAPRQLLDQRGAAMDDFRFLWVYAGLSGNSRQVRSELKVPVPRKICCQCSGGHHSE